MATTITLTEAAKHLDLTPNTRYTKKELRAAYLNQALSSHPDKQPPSETEEWTEKTQNLNAAWEILDLVDEEGISVNVKGEAKRLGKDGEELMELSEVSVKQKKHKNRQKFRGKSVGKEKENGKRDLKKRCKDGF